MYAQKYCKLPRLIDHSVADAADTVTNDYGDFMYEQKCYIFAAEVVFSEDVVLGKKRDEDIDDTTDYKEPTCSIFYKKDDRRKCKIELNQVPDNRVNLISQPGYEILQAFFLKTVEKETDHT
jgi:hypothetical protein